MSIRDLPREERPRERLAELGASHLSSIELIAILLGFGTKEHSALALASQLLVRFRSLEELSEATLQDLLTVKGIGMAKAVTLQAAFHLFKRIRPKSEESALIDAPEKALAEVRPILEEEQTEVLFVLLRDVRKRLLHKEILGRGLLNRLLVHPREVYCTAIRHRAHSIILAHNHPSGDPLPSQTDVDMTHILRTAGAVVGIELADHLIIGKRGRFYSFRANSQLGSVGEGGY
jgi:DNA repair protein RadC